MSRLLGPVSGVAGLLGTLVCAGAMGLALAGAVGVSASASMAGMSAMAATRTQTNVAAAAPAGLLAFLLRAGSAILVVSVVLVTLSLASRRKTAAVPALVGGAILYWGMYAQPHLAVMGAAIVAGLLVWLVAALWVRTTHQHREPVVLAPGAAPRR